MRRYTGIIIGMRQCGGCVEIVEDGAEPGAFPIDNSCFRMIASCEGTDWIGRPVEYEDAFMRFLDSPGDEEELDAARSALPAQQP